MKLPIALLVAVFLAGFAGPVLATTDLIYSAEISACDIGYEMGRWDGTHSAEIISVDPADKGKTWVLIGYIYKCGGWAGAPKDSCDDDGHAYDDATLYCATHYETPCLTEKEHLAKSFVSTRTLNNLDPAESGCLPFNCQ